MNRKQRRRLQKTGARPIAPSDAVAGSNQEALVATLVQANTALMTADPETAERLCDEVLRLSPGHADAMNLKAAVLMERGDTAGAVRIFTKVAALVPGFAQAHFNLGTALNAQGKPKRAIRAFVQALDIDPTYAEAHYNMGNALRQTGQITDAIDHYKAALKINPAHAPAATSLASAHLETGNAREALTAGQLAMQLDPGNRDALSFTAIAATEAGNKQLAQHLLHPQGLIRSTQITDCPGFEDLSTFNAALAAHVLAHPTLAKEPHNKATRNGRQTDNLALGERGPVALLQDMIGTALDDYLAALASDHQHPYPPLIPNLTRIDIWGTVLGAQGHQAGHMHRAAWVSGVYYVKLPDVMHSGSNSTAGWIEFCRPPEQFPCTATHDVHLIEPKEGLLVLFPSFMYHRTIPFESDDTRISIAFDLLG